LRTLRPLCCSRAPVNPEEHLGSPRQRLLLFSAAFANEPLSRGYFPRDVFFFGLGLLVLPVLPGAASFFGRFGDTDSLLPSLAIRSRLRAAAPSPPAGRSARRYRSASPAWQSTEPSHPRPETAIVNGCRKRLPQTSKTGEGRAPVRCTELEPGDGGIAAVPADDPPGEGVARGRPGDSQLITSRPNKTEGITTRACRTAPGATGSPLDACHGWMLADRACAGERS
jgi:hypothetical protein